MTDNAVKEKISESFLTLITATNRYTMAKPSTDEGVDFVVNPSVRRIRTNGEVVYVPSAVKTDIQLKCTTEKYFKLKGNGNYDYATSARTYENLIYRRDEKAYTKLFLIVFVLPANEAEWVRVLDDHIMLSKHAYWFYPLPEYTLDRTMQLKKDSTVSIEILKNNRMDIDFVGILDRINAL